MSNQQLIILSVEQLEEVVNNAVLRAFDAKERKEEAKNAVWVSCKEAMQIMDCNATTLWIRATQEQSIRMQEVSVRKKLYSAHDCRQRRLDKTYRPPIEVNIEVSAK